MGSACPTAGQMAWLKGRPDPRGSAGAGVRAVQLRSSFWTGSTPLECGGGRLEGPQECGWVGCRGGRTWCETADPKPARRGWSHEGSSRESRGGAGEEAHASPRRGLLCSGCHRVEQCCFPRLLISDPPGRVSYSTPAHSFLLVRVRRAPLPRPLPCPLL